MDETLYWIIGFALWIVLQRWVLPKFGIHTCLSPNSSCRTGRKENKYTNVNKIEVEEIKTPED